MNKRKVRITNTGYLPDSPDKHNPMNIIPSNQITMNTVPFPILGIDNLGNHQMMMPGGEYSFPGQYVTEIPMGKYQQGGGIYLGEYEFKDGGLVQMPLGGANRYSGKMTADEFNQLTEKPIPAVLQVPQKPARTFEEHIAAVSPASAKMLEDKKAQDVQNKYMTSPTYKGESYVYKSPEEHATEYEKTADHKLRFKNEADYTP